MRKELFQLKDVGSFPIEAIIEDAGSAFAADMVTQMNKVFVLTFIDYDSVTKLLRISLTPGNGMVSVLVPENDADVRRIDEMKARAGMQDCE
jgi:hypothetical protein